MTLTEFVRLWPDAFRLHARADGWSLTWRRTNAGGVVLIRSNDLVYFTHDDLVRHVHRRAAEGSSVHQRAVRILLRTTLLA